MKTFVSVVFIPVIFLVWLACEDNSTPESSVNTIKAVRVETGGCNGKSFEELKDVRVTEYDTVEFSMYHDTLAMFIGLQYACCAPFELKQTISGDTLLVQIADTCTGIDCHCRCMCYYSWDIYFVDYLHQSYYFKVMLKDIGSSDYSIFREGKVDIKPN